jgi:hypothetical protein
MVFPNASAPRAQDKKSSKIRAARWLHESPVVIVGCSPFAGRCSHDHPKSPTREDADGGGLVVCLGASKADTSRVGGSRVEVVQNEDDPPIELHQHLKLTIINTRTENWTKGPAVIIEVVAEIVQFTPKFYVRVDGISVPDCRTLEKRFGPNFPALIAADPHILPIKTRFSEEKRDIIFKACKREIPARKNDTTGTLKIVAMLCACGVTKAKAGKLAANYYPAKSPISFFSKDGSHSCKRIALRN